MGFASTFPYHVIARGLSKEMYKQQTFMHSRSLVMNVSLKMKVVLVTMLCSLTQEVYNLISNCLLIRSF